jgi:hypothetical protein
MDHLPYPTHPSSPAIEIEFICASVLKVKCTPILVTSSSWEGRDVDIGYWQDWKKDVEYWSENASDDNSARYLQAHVYFGYLLGLLGDSFKVADFLRDGDRYVTLRNLDTLLFRTGQNEKLEMRSGAKLYYRYLRDFQIRTKIHSSLVRKIALSIEVLAHTLPYLYLRGGIQLSSFESKQLIKERILSSGWCMYWTERWSEECSLPFLYYLGAIEPSTKRPFTRTRMSSCSRELCTCNNVDQNKYRTSHTLDCRGDSCDFAGPSTDYVARIVKNDAIPILKLTRKPAGVGFHAPRDNGDGIYRNPTWNSGDYDYELTVVEYTPDIEFVAISHVWSMGLGNFNANELPYCQLEFLYDHIYDCKQNDYDRWLDSDFGNRINSLSYQTWLYPWLSTWKFKSAPDAVRGKSYDESVYLWHDTICIPAAKGTTSEDCRAMKQKAINKMAIVYTSAAHVLIVDPLILLTFF